MYANTGQIVDDVLVKKPCRLGIYMFPALQAGAVVQAV
jgi:hypothetical protein